MKRALCGVGVVLFLVACGGGGGGTTKAAYVRKANAVCRDAAKQVAGLTVPSRENVRDTAKAAAKVVEAQRAALERIRAIKPPKRDRTEIAKWIALVDQTIDQAELSARSQKYGDLTRAVTANVNGAALDRRADELARAYGLRTCVQAATAPTTTTSTKPKA
jgi:hypothetical protein